MIEQLQTPCQSEDPDGYRVLTVHVAWVDKIPTVSSMPCAISWAVLLDNLDNTAGV